MAVGQALLTKQLKPMVRDSIECCALAGNTIHATLTLPNTLKGRNSVANNHNRQRCISGNIIAFLSDQATAVSLRQPVD